MLLELDHEALAFGSLLEKRRLLAARLLQLIS